MNWNRALKQMQTGAKIRRPGWPDLAYIMIVDGLIYGKRKGKTGATYFSSFPQNGYGKLIGRL